MSAVSITAANVAPSSAASPRKIAIAGVAITAGQLIYLDTADSNKAKLADADADATSVVAGIAINNAAAGQPVAYIEEDSNFTIGGTVTAGVAYFLGLAGGDIVPYADIATGDFVTVIGVGKTGNKLHFKPLYTGQAI